MQPVKCCPVDGSRDPAKDGRTRQFASNSAIQCQLRDVLMEHRIMLTLSYDGGKS